ncbi:hypothetical protein FTV88_1613 [Heliorestis convoluta]|uniref:Uncharacterized protein n=1 Tax=Heliorestis convoluta TaxID=356322 RepID=A0A5Q2N1K9_9FIRM|nr:hypothetical protein FTV88_1613 [Heliorestis convoluta]
MKTLNKILMLIAPIIVAALAIFNIYRWYLQNLDQKSTALFLVLIVTAGSLFWFVVALFVFFIN